MRALVDPHLRDLVPYIPGKPIEETEREFGVKNIAKLASNENCLGPSPLAVAAMQRTIASSHLYPDAGAFYLKDAICRHHATHGVRPEHVVVGNGTNEILTLVVRAFVGEGEAILNAWPSFVIYRLAARAAGRAEIAVPLTSSYAYDFDAMGDALAREKDRVKLVFLANPNNPTGRAFDDRALSGFLARVPDDVVVVIDEAYVEYVRMDGYPDGVKLALERPRTIVTRTFSKAFGLAALRIGYAVGDVAMIDVLNRLRDPFNTSSLAQAAAIAALSDTAHVARTVAHNTQEIVRLTDGLVARGFTVTPSDANFVLAHLPAGAPDVGSLDRALLSRAVIVRPLQGYGLPRSVRITVGTESENARLLKALDDVLKG
jgi:histidinol-phosphate aminotransferase